MYSCQLQLLLFALCGAAYAAPATKVTEAPVAVITEDIILDLENTSQKVIRVNPVDLPSKADKNNNMDSELFNVQTLKPATANRHYMNTNRMRRKRPSSVGQQKDTPMIRQVSEPKPTKSKSQKQKRDQQQIHFLYEQPEQRVEDLTKAMQVRLAPGAYPVYYVVSKSNGRFGKFPIKGFSSQADFIKYLLKSKAMALEPDRRFERFQRFERFV